MTGIEMISAERQRQIDVEGWTSKHDREHTRGELAVAAACYAVEGTGCCVLDSATDDAWPWNAECDKRQKHDPIRRLVIAGALILAEIDRLAAQEEKGAKP